MVFGSIYIIFPVKVCNETVNIFIKHHMTNCNINLKFHCLDLKVPIVAETPMHGMTGLPATFAEI